ncbi:unnamed protein product [Calypogeia fissa]
MTRSFLSWNAILGVAAVFFLVVQIRLFRTQTDYVDQIKSEIRSENDCTDRMRVLVDRLASNQGKLSSLEEQKNKLELKVHQLDTLLQDHGRREASRFPDHGTRGLLTAVVIMACNRQDYLERTIKSVLKYHGAVASKFPLFISQDGSDEGVETLAKSRSEFTFMQHLNFQEPTPRPAPHLLAYYKIASHYKWALSKLFSEFQRVIILEDDMEIAPDFFDYFEATGALLDNDMSLMAVSSWNDNGQKQFVQDSVKLYRSDFFPGLGWMLNKAIWDELAPKWPDAYWDDWMRQSTNRKGRHFIRPEVCRTYNFGEQGSSQGQFFKQYLAHIKLNDVAVNWKTTDLSYLLEPKYSKDFGAAVNEAMPIPLGGAVSEASRLEGDVRIEYNSQEMFEEAAQQFGVFEEWKDGVPRTGYKGVVVFRWQGPRRVFFVSTDSELLEDQ